MTRVAAIDCGTNSIRLLVADVGPDGSAREVTRRMEVVRLGHGVDRTGRIAPQSLARTLAMTRTYAAQCDDLGVDRVCFVATSAARDARNALDFVEGVREAFGPRGVTPEVVSGAEEAGLSFAGATAGLAAAGITGPYVVVDLGGGSTEFVRGDSFVEAACSVDIGCVRMTERHLIADPPSPQQIEAARADIDAALRRAEASVGFAGVAALIGLAGSVTTVTAHALHLDGYDRDRIHLARPPVADLLAACDDLLHRTLAQRAELGFMHAGRIDVIGAGALVWSRIVQRVVASSPLAEVITSEHDILDGIALRAAAPLA